MRFSSPHCVLLDGFQSDEMTGCMHGRSIGYKGSGIAKHIGAALFTKNFNATIAHFIETYFCVLEKMTVKVTIL